MSNCKTKKCGCLDTGLTTPTPCIHDTVECPDPNPCSETFSDQCIIHNGDTIVDLDLQQGDSMDTILQKLTLWLTNPGCIDPGSQCKAVLGLHSITVTPSTIKIGWTSEGTPLSFQVEYKLASALSWTLNPALPITSVIDTIGNLTPNSDYHIRVNAVCAAGSCYSVTILVKTKSL